METLDKFNIINKVKNNDKCCPLCNSERIMIVGSVQFEKREFFCWNCEKEYTLRYGIVDITNIKIA